MQLPLKLGITAIVFIILGVLLKGTILVGLGMFIILAAIFDKVFAE